MNLDHDVTVVGRSGKNQIDVAWRFRVPGGQEHLVLFECRRYRDPLKRKDVFAFDGVVRDVAALSTATVTGVMVTTTGYQSGAQEVALHNQVVIVELRDPSEADLRGRVVSLHLNVAPLIPVVRNVQVTPAEPPSGRRAEGYSDELHLRLPGGAVRRLTDVLLDGEWNPANPSPAPLRPVRRAFDPPAELIVSGEVIVRISQLTADVGVELGEASVGTVGGRDWLAWVVCDTLHGSRAWCANDGTVIVTSE